MSPRGPTTISIDSKKSEPARTTDAVVPEHGSVSLPEDVRRAARHSDGAASGFKTPSDPGTPRVTTTGIETPTGSPYYGMKQEETVGGMEHMEHMEHMEQMEHWDWHADAPEFFPGGEEAGFMNGAQIDPQNPGIVWVPSCVPGDASAAAAAVYQQQGWQMSPQAMQGSGMENGVALNGPDDASWTQSQNMQQMQEQNMRQMQEMMNTMEMEMTKLKAGWDMERRKLVAQLQRARAVLERYCIPLEEAAVDESLFDLGGNYFPGYEPEQNAQWNGTGGPAQDMNAGMYNMRPDAAVATQQRSSLDWKMQQLGSLLQDGTEGYHHSVEDCCVSQDANLVEADANYGNGTVASLRNMFTEAKVRTAQDIEQEVMAEMTPVKLHLMRIENIVNSQADDRAVRALMALGEKEGLEALGKVEELVESQGGSCRNLSSILQSVCRKIEKKGARGQDRNAASKTLPPSSVRLRKEPYEEREREYNLNTEGSFNETSTAAAHIIPEVKPTANKSVSRTVSQNSDGSKKSRQLSWADISSEDEQETTEAETATPPNGSVVEEVWTTKQVEKVARKGFDLRRRGGRWQLRITMAALQPQLTETGLANYCSWLSVRFTAFKEEHGSGALHRCAGEVDFSDNGMDDGMLWKLLETLSTFKVQVTTLKLGGNKLTHTGALAICEFLRVNQADPVQELHVGHNELDDEAAMEIIRTFQGLRFPPATSTAQPGPQQRRNSADGGGTSGSLAPFWVGLEHNKIADVDAIRSAAELEEGINLRVA